MFSGKSEEMIRRLRRAEIAGQRVLLFKPRIDDRYDAADVVSHAGVRMSAVPVDGCSELVARARGCEVVGIDEAQFFEPTIVDAALALADGGVRVIAAGLDQDFRRQPFGPMPELLARAEFVDKLQAVCHRCGGPATTTQRLVDGRPAPYSGETIVVGALDSYEARCRDCHNAGQDAAKWLAACRATPDDLDRTALLVPPRAPTTPKPCRVEAARRVSHADPGIGVLRLPSAFMTPTSDQFFQAPASPRR
jgi:thymidine kinase